MALHDKEALNAFAEKWARAFYYFDFIEASREIWRNKNGAK